MRRAWCHRPALTTQYPALGRADPERGVPARSERRNRERFITSHPTPVQGRLPTPADQPEDSATVHTRPDQSEDVASDRVSKIEGLVAIGHPIFGELKSSIETAPQPAPKDSRWHPPLQILPGLRSGDHHRSLGISDQLNSPVNFYAVHSRQITRGCGRVWPRRSSSCVP